jgi:soluble lytic murein transglycosylase-like protein
LYPTYPRDPRKKMGEEMPTVGSPFGRDKKSPRSGWRRSFVGTCVLTLVALVALMEGYFSFKYPIKQDRHRHRFSEHLVDRTRAYALLLQSPHRGKNSVLSPESILGIVREAAETHGVDPCLGAAVLIFESGFNPNTITTTGAMGLMALQPKTAALLDVNDPFDPVQNVDGGIRMLRSLLLSFGGDSRLALAGYNAGPGAVRKYAGVPPFRETKDYVKFVGAIYDLCRAKTAVFFSPDGEDASG